MLTALQRFIVRRSRRNKKIVILRQTQLFLSSHILVDLRVEEQRVHAPGEGTVADVQVLVGRGLGELAAVLVLEVLLVLRVILLNAVGPSGGDNDARDADVVADLPPEVGGLCCVSASGVLLRLPAVLGGVASGAGKSARARCSAEELTTEIGRAHV